MLKKGLIASVAVLALLVLMFRPALLKTDTQTRLLALFRWQSGEIKFVNSVTQRPVVIRFNIGSRFHNFSILTDEATEEYYSHGLYDLKRAVSKDSTMTLKFCSMKGISVTVGFYRIHVQDGCLEVSILWKI
ncbi:MAG: hypothetical protein C4582_04975 [Desulfobacteraceae bacterium]|jgi:hypothetical protein|nr:MAG: hypothetical protein C4582_04975 [Desulfobacteraceae bacterium]